MPLLVWKIGCLEFKAQRHHNMANCGANLSVGIRCAHQSVGYMYIFGHGILILAAITVAEAVEIYLTFKKFDKQ